MIRRSKNSTNRKQHLIIIGRLRICFDLPPPDVNAYCLGCSSRLWPVDLYRVHQRPQVATLWPHLNLLNITTMCGYVTVAYRYKCNHVVKHPRQFAPCENARITGRNCRTLNPHQKLGSIAQRGKCPTCRAADRVEIRSNSNKKMKKKKDCVLL